VARHLEGYHGILQVDGDTAYQRLARPERAVEGVQLAA
jgi:transposase